MSIKNDIVKIGSLSIIGLGLSWLLFDPPPPAGTRRVSRVIQTGNIQTVVSRGPASSPAISSVRVTAPIVSGGPTQRGSTGVAGFTSRRTDLQ